jgi:bacteriocin-like protein
MKTKTFSKKLSLNKKTVANLNDKEMQGIYGGETLELTVCITRCGVSDCACTFTRCSDCCPP